MDRRGGWVQKDMIILHAYIDVLHLASGLPIRVMQPQFPTDPSFVSHECTHDRRTSRNTPNHWTNASARPMQSIHIMAYIAGIIINREKEENDT